MGSSCCEAARPVHVIRFFGFLLLLAGAFAVPLYQLGILAANSAFLSYILLIPFLAGFLVILRRKNRPESGEPARRSAVCLWIAGAGLVIGAVGWRASLSHNDRLALLTLAFLLLLLGGVLFFLGKSWVRAFAFPLAMLLFLVPLPDLLVVNLERLLVIGTVELLDPLFHLTGIPAWRDGMVFHVPGITIEVARECSGIRSTLVLLIAGLFAAFLFLESPWHRLILVSLVFPLGLIRNAFRIWVIAWLCVRRGPEMIHSPIHEEGGPWFFALSLVPLFVLIWWMRGRERKEKSSLTNPGEVPGRLGVPTQS